MDRKCKDVAVGDQTTLNIGPIVCTTITKVLGSNGWGKQSPLFLDQLSSHISFQITALNKPQPAGTAPRIRNYLVIHIRIHVMGHA